MDVRFMWVIGVVLMILFVLVYIIVRCVAQKKANRNVTPARGSATATTANEPRQHHGYPGPPPGQPSSDVPVGAPPPYYSYSQPAPGGSNIYGDMAYPPPPPVFGQPLQRKQ